MEDVVPAMMGGPLKGPNFEPLFEWSGKQCEFFDGGNGERLVGGRILQYCTLPHEPSLVIENARPSQNWPSQGTIEIHNLQGCYNAHSPLVLHGLTYTFNDGEKLGIVGRTGSGNSTLIQALFRMVEPVGGSIEIDKLDLSTIGNY